MATASCGILEIREEHRWGGSGEKNARGSHATKGQSFLVLSGVVKRERLFRRTDDSLTR